MSYKINTFALGIATMALSAHAIAFSNPSDHVVGNMTTVSSNIFLIGASVVPGKNHLYNDPSVVQNFQFNPSNCATGSYNAGTGVLSFTATFSPLKTCQFSVGGKHGAITFALSFIQDSPVTKMVVGTTPNFYAFGIGAAQLPHPPFSTKDQTFPYCGNTCSVYVAKNVIFNG